MSFFEIYLLKTGSINTLETELLHIQTQDVTIMSNCKLQQLWVGRNRLAG